MAVIKCPDCGKEVSTKAESCPNCGRILIKKTGCVWGFIKAFLFLFLIFMIIDVYRTFSREENVSKNEDQQKIVLEEYSTKTIYKEFSDNLVRAGEKFKNKEIVIIGRYDSMRQNMITEKILDVYLDNDVVCVFRRDNIKPLEKLKKGNTVKMKGTFSGKRLLGYTFDGCELIEVK